MSFLEYRAQKGQAGRAQISYTVVWLGINGTGEKVFHLYDKTEYRDPPMSMMGLPRAGDDGLGSEPLSRQIVTSRSASSK
jgi:hypothetical protein